MDPRPSFLSRTRRFPKTGQLNPSLKIFGRQRDFFRNAGLWRGRPKSGAGCRLRGALARSSVEAANSPSR
jgi:hypothetical protein